MANDLRMLVCLGCREATRIASYMGEWRPSAEGEHINRFVAQHMAFSCFNDKIYTCTEEDLFFGVMSEDKWLIYRSERRKDLA